MKKKTSRKKKDSSKAKESNSLMIRPKSCGSKIKKTPLLPGKHMKDVPLAGERGMSGPDDWRDLIAEFERLTAFCSQDGGGGGPFDPVLWSPNPNAPLSTGKKATTKKSIKELGDCGEDATAPSPVTTVGFAVASAAAPDSAQASSASASSSGGASASASSASPSSIPSSEYPVAEDYISDVLEDGLDFTPDDVNIPCEAARTAILNATRSIAEFNFRRASRELAMASIYGTTRARVAKYGDLLDKLGKEIETGVVAGEHEFLQGKIAEAQVKANLTSPRLSARATVIASIVSDRMRGRIIDAQLATGVSEKNAQLATSVSEKNATLQSSAQENNARLSTGVNEKNAQLATGISQVNAQLTTEVSKVNAQLETEVSVVNANNITRVTVSLNNFWASLYSSAMRVRQYGVGSLLGAIANQCGTPGISWIEVS